MNFDLSQPKQLMLALGPDLLLMGGAILILLWSAWGREDAATQRLVGYACMFLTVLTAIACGYYYYQGYGAAPGGMIAVDGFRWAADIIFLIGTLLTLALAVDYNDRETLWAPESHVLILLATAGMMLLAAARDLMLVFLGIELMSISVYALVGLNRRSVRSAEGALKYFLLGAFSTGFLLYGIALLYGAAGTTNLSVLGQRVLELDLARSPMLMAGIALLLIGFAFKVAAAPFHMWAPDAYEGAPTPITAYMAAAVKAAAFAAFLRVWLEAFPYVVERWYAVMWWLAVVTMVVGNVIALAQRNIKRLLAYSSIAHAGYVLVAIVVNSQQGISAFLFYLFAYTLATMGAFAVVVALGSRGETDLTVDGYSGLWSERPGLAVAMTVFMLALLGFPLFGGIGFMAKWYMIKAALQASQPQTRLAVILVLTSVISAGYYLYVVMVMFMRPRRETLVFPRRAGGLTTAVVAATAILIVVLGLFPDWVAWPAGTSARPTRAAATAPVPSSALR